MQIKKGPSNDMYFDILMFLLVFNQQATVNTMVFIMYTWSSVSRIKYLSSKMAIIQSNSKFGGFMDIGRCISALRENISYKKYGFDIFKSIRCEKMIIVNIATEIDNHVSELFA